MQPSLQSREVIGMAQNVIDTLKQEHQMVLSLLSELSSKGISNRQQTYNSLKENLIPHMIGEEKSLYPRLERESDMRDMALEAIEEHNAVKSLLSQLDNASTSEEDVWVAKITVIQENVKHHISEEEEHIFPQMQQKMSSELSDLDTRYQEAKRSALPVAAQ
ncbi:hemerythrin domain-containing protein [Methanoculleus sp.]|uniref:hemerythrin domain-containing protein n=1 Tax=Methanoculleus sp. TaxID=90427 RepID=UPI0025D22D79|nr:hemerythrin domain-containing protein [Methanoculleus sp.]